MKMKVVSTFPGADNFDLFDQVVRNLYTAEELRHKSAEMWSTEWCETLLVVLDEGVPVARAGVFFNPLLNYEGHRTLQVGCYACVDRQQVATFLFDYLIRYAGSRGFSRIVGPMNGSTWHSYRFVSADTIPSPLFFGEPCFHSYYVRQWIEYGFSEIGSYYSAGTDQLSVTLPELPGFCKNLEAEGVSIRSIDLENYSDELENIFPFLLDAFQNNFLYSPLSKEAFLDLYVPAKAFLKSEFVLIAEDRNKAVVGIYFCVDDVYDSTRKSLIIKTIARNSAPGFRGLGQVMSKIIYERALASGYSRIIHGFMIENGSVTNTTRRFLGKPFRKYGLYGLTP